MLPINPRHPGCLKWPGGRTWGARTNSARNSPAGDGNFVKSVWRNSACCFTFCGWKTHARPLLRFDSKAPKIPVIRTPMPPAFPFENSVIDQEPPYSPAWHQMLERLLGAAACRQLGFYAIPSDL